MIHLNAHFYAGGDDNLAVIMGAYQSASAIYCLEKFDSPESCVQVLDDMQTAKTLEIFGARTNPSATIKGPHAFYSGRLVNQNSLLFRICLF